jgi:hypothetical protein
MFEVKKEKNSEDNDLLLEACYNLCSPCSNLVKRNGNCQMNITVQVLTQALKVIVISSS